MKKTSNLTGLIGLAVFLGVLPIGVLAFLLSFTGLIPPDIGGPIFGGCVFTALASVLGMVIAFGVHIKRLPQLVRELGNPTKSQKALERIVNMGERAVPVLLEALSSPAMNMSGCGMEAWDGNLAHRAAVEGLRRLKATEAVLPLMQVLKVEVLKEADKATRVEAIKALSEIGDARAMPALIPLLGDGETVGGRTVADCAADALATFGETELVLAFMQTLEGDKTALETLRGKYQREVIEGLILKAASHHQSDEMRVNALWALGELRAVEVLPKLRLGLKIMAVGGVFGVGSERLKRACEDLIAHLEAIESATGTLPRTAEAVAPDIETLPRSAAAPLPDTETLPRPPEQHTVNGLR
jgi:hypothetical protein